MDYNKRYFESFSCRPCAWTMIELLHLMFARKTSSFNARLSSHAATPDVTFHGYHTHTTCSHMHSHRNAQECVKTTVMYTKLPCATCGCEEYSTTEGMKTTSHFVTNTTLCFKVDTTVQLLGHTDANECHAHPHTGP